LKLLFKAGERSGLPLDMHIDEHLNDVGLLFQPLIELTKAYGMGGRVIAGHCSALDALSPSEARRVAEGFAQAGIAVVTLPAANLFLQGRDAARLTPRGLTRVKQLLASGVQVAAGSDNIQDPFVPTGSGDLVEIARWTLLAGHLGLNDLSVACNMVAATPAKLMGLADWGLHVGARADLLITAAASVEDLVASGAPERLIMVGGRFIHPKSEAGAGRSG
jgi:cytosine deaminase